MNAARDLAIVVGVYDHDWVPPRPGQSADRRPPHQRVQLNAEDSYLGLDKARSGSSRVLASAMRALKELLGVVAMSTGDATGWPGQIRAWHAALHHALGLADSGANRAMLASAFVDMLLHAAETGEALVAVEDSLRRMASVAGNERFRRLSQKMGARASGHDDRGVGPTTTGGVDTARDGGSGGEIGRAHV